MNSPLPSNLGPWLPAVVFGIALLFAFKVWMIIDAGLNKELDDRTKTLWLLGMLLIHPFVAIAYFFAEYRRR